MKTATINLKVLAALSLCAATEKIRYYLCGVCVEIAPRHVTYVATDGGVLAAHREELADDAPDNELLGSFIIPTAACTKFKLKKRASTVGTIMGDAEDLTIAYGAERIGFKPVDGTFPGWRHVVPALPTGETKPAQFSPSNVSRLADVGARLGYGAMCLHHNGYNPTLVDWQGNTDTVAVIMPYRLAIEPKHPAWFVR
jgi:DNA polymerase III sliding clamp (beta) subunit (PCNA family)